MTRVRPKPGEDSVITMLRDQFVELSRLESEDLLLNCVHQIESIGHYLPDLLFFAIRQNRPKTALRLIECGSQVIYEADGQKDDVLIAVFDCRKFDDQLFRNLAEADCLGFTDSFLGISFKLLERSAMQGNYLAFTTLLALGADPHVETFAGQSLLVLAIQGDNASIVEAVVGMTICESSSYQGLSMLQLAAKGNSWKCIKVMVESGMEVDDLSHVQRTALTVAISSGSKHAAAALILSGADINRIDQNGNTALSRCIFYLEDPSWMINLGANVNYRYPNGESLLKRAIRLHATEVVDILIQHGARIDDD